MSAKLNNSQQNSNSFPTKKDGKLDFSEIKRVFNIGINYLSGNSGDTLESVVFGGMQPNVLEIEEAVLGALLVDDSAFPKIKDILGKHLKPFYKDANNAVWEAIMSLDRKENELDRCIDRLTVYMEMERLGSLKAIGGNPFYLIQLTDGVSSSAHIEAHVRILLQTHIQRKLLNMSILMVQQMYSKTTDPLKSLDFHVKQLTEFQEHIFGDDLLLEKKSGGDLIKMMHEARESQKIMGDFLTQGGITLLFAPAKVGKSIASVMFGIDAAAGTGSFGGVLANEVGKQKVAYFDFELTPSDWKARYGCKETHTYFDFATQAPTFVRYSEKQIFKNYESFASIVIKELKHNVHQDRPDVIILDNLTYLTDGSIEPTIATSIMKTLKEFNKMYGTSILVLCHTPKQGKNRFEMTEDSMAGSAQLKNFATDVVGIANSALGEGHVYFKHLISRGRKVEFDGKKTIHCKIEKKGPFLGMQFIDFCEESEHLAKWESKEEEEDVMTEVMKLEGTMGARAIIEKLRLPFSHTGLLKKIKRFKQAKSQEKDFDTVLKNNVIDPSLSLLTEDETEKTEVFEIPELDKTAEIKQFASEAEFKETTSLYFSAVKRIGQQEHLKLNFVSEPKSDAIAYVEVGGDTVFVNLCHWKGTFKMCDASLTKGAYKYETIKQTQRGIKGQYLILWLLCHEVLHLVEPNLKHGKEFANRVEHFYNKCLTFIRVPQF